MTRRQRWLVALAVAAGVLLGLWLARRPLLRTAGAWLDAGVAPQKADAVMVLNGNYNTRPFAAAALVKGGWARRVLICTVAPSFQVEEGAVLPWHEGNRRVLRHCGVPEQDILLLDRKARTTFDEAVGLADYLASSPESRVLVVTDGPHTRRARWVFARVLGSRASQCSVVSAPCDDFSMDNWWHSELGFNFVLGEYLKLAFYGIRYGYLGYEAAVAAGLLLGLWVYWRRRRNRHGVTPHRRSP